MKIAFDIGGVLSKYPDELKILLGECRDEYSQTDIYIITDQHPKEQVIKVLKDNGFINNFPPYSFIQPENVYCADYKKYGEMCKAILLRDLKIDIYIDDFAGYLNWDYRWGKPPLRLFVWPDASREYHHPDWVQPGHGFGKEKWEINNGENT